MNGREYKAFNAEIKEVDGRSVTGIAAVAGNVDSYRDRIWTGAFKKTIKENVSGRIKHLWQHDWASPPIAVIRKLQEVSRDELSTDAIAAGAKGGLLVVREYLDTERADEVLKGILAGAITEMSFAYDAVKFDYEEDEETHSMIRNLRELRLWETSDVLWGANPLTEASKSAMPFRDTGVAPEGESWSRPGLSDFTADAWGDLSDAEKNRIAAHFAWRGEDDTFGNLKLPHHRPAKSGVGPAVWAGVRAAMNVLLGGMGGTSIPDAQRRSVYRHLARHYTQFDKEPPDFRWFLLADAITNALSEDTVPALGLVDMAALQDINQRLRASIELAEPVQDDNPDLTRQVLQRLKLAENSLYGGSRHGSGIRA